MTSTIPAEQLQYYRSQMTGLLDFSEVAWQIFSSHLYPKSVKKKTLWVQQGKPCNEVAFIYAGSFRFFFTKDGNEISNYFSFKGELVSSYASFLRQQPSHANIEAMEDSEILCLSSSSMQELMENTTVQLEMEKFRRNIAEYLICCFEDRLISFISRTPEERYHDLLTQQPDLFQRIPQHYIANFLGITPVSLSRIRKRIMQQQ